MLIFTVKFKHVYATTVCHIGVHFFNKSNMIHAVQMDEMFVEITRMFSVTAVINHDDYCQPVKYRK